MAFVGLRDVVTKLTDQDMSAQPYRIVRTVAGRVRAASAGSQQPIGITTEDVANGSVTAASVGVAVGGRTKVECGGTVADGVALMSDANGRAITATGTNYHIGFAEEDGVNLQRIEITIDRGQLN